MPTWKKSPPDLIERFTQALPAHPDLVQKPMFGYPAAFVHGNMVCGLFQDCVVVRLGKNGAAEAVALRHATQFAPIPGRAMTGYVLVPAADVESPSALSGWLQCALDFTLTLPAKQKGSAADESKTKARRRAGEV